MAAILCRLYLAATVYTQYNAALDAGPEAAYCLKKKKMKQEHFWIFLNNVVLI